MTNKNIEVLRSTISHAAISAGLALSATAFSDTAAAQSQTQQQSDPQQTGQGATPSNVQLRPITVTGRPRAPARRRAPVVQPSVVTPGPAPIAEGAYNVPTAASPKQTAPLLNTPQTVTVVPRAIIREQGARTLTDVLRTTPGITFDAGENGFGSTTNHFKLRGFNTTSDVFIDGSRDNGNYARDVFNIDRVEIFKGPSSDNGRGGAGGYINLVTKTPTLQNFFSGEVGYGWDDYRSVSRKRATVDANYRLNDKWAFRFNGLLEESGVAGREIAEMRPRGVAPSLAYGLGTDFRAIFLYEHQSRQDRPDWGVPGATIPGTVNFAPAAGNALRDNFYGLRSDFDNVKADTLLARFEYDISKNATITNQTRWAEVHREARYTVVTAVNPATLLVTTQNQRYDRTNTTLTNLTNYSAEFFTGAVKHNLSVGLDLTHEDSDSGRFGTGANHTTTNIFNPNPDRVQAFAARVGTGGVTVKSAGLYAYDTIHLSRQWQISSGVRVDHYNVRISSKNLAGLPLDATDGVDLSATTLGGKFGVVYKPVENASVYATVGLSHQPPGSNLMSNPDISRNNDDAFPNFIPNADPVRLLSYEVGVKWDFFNGRLSTTAALFHLDKRVPITGCTPANPANPIAGCAIVGAPETLMGYGHQIAQGVELGVAGDLTPNWKMFAGLLLMRTERQHSAELDAARMAFQPGDYPVGFRNGTNGDQLAFTPNVSANLWTTYLVPTTNWTVGGGVQYVGESFAGRPDDAARIIPNGRFGKLPSYFLIHAMTSYEIKKDVHVRFNVDNITDERAAISMNWPAVRGILATSRAYRISTNFKF